MQTETPTKQGRLCLTRKVGDAILITDGTNEIEICVVDLNRYQGMTGRRCKLAIKAPKQFQIVRGELLNPPTDDDAAREDYERRKAERELDNERFMPL